MSSVVSANGVLLNYFEEGRGQPVVFVHGSLSDYRTWAMQVSDFSRIYRAISYSRRCHYPNPWTEYPGSYSVDTEKDDLVAFIKALGIKEAVHLVGSSYGAFACALVARDNPELVRSLILGEPPIFSLLLGNELAKTKREDFEKNLESSVLKPLESGDLEAGVRGFIDSVSGEGTYSRFTTDTKDRLLQNARALKYELTTPERDHFSLEDARKISAPTLLLRGQYSPLVFHLISETLERNLRRSQVAMIPNSSHSIHTHNPKVYDEAVIRFLGNH